MRKIIYILSAVLLMVSCEEKIEKDYVTLSGQITNKSSEQLTVRSRSFSKEMKVNEDGTFSDTLNVATGTYSLYDGNEQTSIYLKNGFNLTITLDTKQFDETVKFEGLGAEPNNYLAAKSLLQEKIIEDETMYLLDKPDFNKKITEVKSTLTTLLNETKKLDTSFISQQIKQIDGFSEYIAKSYSDKQYMATFLAKGKQSPTFSNFENNKGGTTSLSDLKGKYVYVDVWATWCGPCKAEIPFLKKVEKTYHNKNIEFVSISVDKAKDHNAWEQMIADKELGGIQLFADNNWKSEFVEAYKINGIPRFILIDPNGNIVSSNAPRPSSNELKVLFEELKL